MLQSCLIAAGILIVVSPLPRIIQRAAISLKEENKTG